MTSALIPLAASSLIALSAGAPSGGHARQDAPAAQQGPSRAGERPQGNVGAQRAAPKNKQGAARTAPANAHRDSASSGARPASGNTNANARTAPDRGGQNHQQASGQAHQQASASRNPPPRGASSHAAPAHQAAPGPRPGYRPAPHYSPWDPTPHRVYVNRHQHVEHWHPAYWSAGVFVYAAPPPPVAGRPARTQAKATPPARDLDRSNSLSIGLRSGSFMSSYDGGASYGDFGVGVTARYRANEALGLEASYGYFSDTFTESTERVSQPISASVELFAFPWTKVSPYVLGGVTWTARSYEDSFTTLSGVEEFSAKDVQFGPHGGVGLELAVGESASINFEGRYTHFVTQNDDDSSAPGALQGLVGLNLYF